MKKYALNGIHPPNQLTDSVTTIDRNCSPCNDMYVVRIISRYSDLYPGMKEQK